MTQVVELYVVMHCEDCAISVKRAIKKTPGVESYKIDYYGQKVIVVGNVDRDDVWRRIHRTGRHVMLIVDPAPPKEETKKEEKKEGKKEEKKEEKKEVKVEEKKTKETKKVETQEGVKVEEVVKVVETKKVEKKQEQPKVEEKKEETKAEAKKKEPERPQEPEWVPMFVTAPYYTLPSRSYNY